ncbi:hypothetical protein L210DRAFT_957644 [Boletus edulis BED1]|uniref:Receptor-activated Ca2+-permeable cation channel n=1 Tax=Boletus edulis BED1 TaxID=1328754 RepID=A0AAD4GK22_BOLED|nr:hypothetical protein L210DRAFT_957644 [Boletus edulis BED1]
MERQPLLGTMPVWPIIHAIRALTAPDLTYTLVRPLEDKYNGIQRAGNKSVVFSFLINRIYFLREQNNLMNGPLFVTRATLCELLAIRILRDNGNSLLDLVRTLTTSWPVWSGADTHVLEQARQLRDDDLEDHVGNAIELAIISKSRRFIKSSPCQRVIDAIWIGKCVYQAESSHAILSDRYKRTPIHLYDPHKAPLLDHYRLKVPAIRAVLEFVNFLILFILFVIAIEMNERHRINTAETAFMLYALGFALERLATMQEHGIKVYFKGTWNGFDLAFVTAYIIYAIFRIYGIVYHERWARDIGIDFLAVIACLLFPRLAFVTLQNNLMVLALRAMIMQFVALMLIAAFCFCGFLYALWTLSRKGAGTIAWWMLDLWFGLDASGFDRAGEFDPVIGPILMITYACLSNTLLLTGTSSLYHSILGPHTILSNTFARISEDAAAETMFRKAVFTIEGVKADSLFSYQPPVNLVAVCILLPASYVLSPRWFHKVNVFLIRLTNFPILLVIAWFERQAKKTGSLGFYETISSLLEKVTETVPRSLKRMSLFEGLAGPGADIDVVFDIEDEMEQALETEDDPDRIIVEPPLTNGLERRRSSHPSTRSLRPAHPPSPKERDPDHHSQRAPPRPPSPLRAGGHHHLLTSAPVSLRRRLTPSIHKHDVAQSPLAQIFQSVMLDEFHASEDNVSDSASGGGTSAFLTQPQLSYGPATRRRLASMHSVNKRPSETSLWTTKLAGPVRPAIPPLDTREEMLSGLLSASPDQQEGEQQGIATAEQVEENMEENGSMTEWMKRMGAIERRQERIEELLVQLQSQLQR